MQIKVVIRCLTLTLLSFSLLGCGFKLAGNTSLPESLASIHLVTSNFSDNQRASLIERLNRAGATLTGADGDSTVLLTVSMKTIPDRTLVLSASTGKTVKRLARQLSFNLKSTSGALLAGKTLQKQVDIELDSDNLHASVVEKSKVSRDLELALFNQLIHQLKSI